MKEYLNRITKSLAFRIFIPLFTIALISGLVLYIFVLRSVSGFADEHIKGNISDMSLDIYNICDKNLNDLLMKGLLADEKSVRFRKGLTIGMIEDYMKQNGLKGAIIEKEKEILRIGDFSTELLQTIEDTEEHTVSLLKYAGERYYATHSHFEPWNWHFILIKDATAYSGLIHKVNRAYASAAIIFFVVLFFSLYFLNRYIRYPVSTIIKSIKKSEKPEYRGIYEFEFLSDNISQTMESLQKETKMLNNLYYITVSKKGEDFFDEVVMAIGRMFGLNSLIARVSPDGEAAEVMSLYLKGELKKNLKISLKGTPCEGVVAKKHMCVIERDAYKQFPNADLLLSIKADSYIGLAVFNRKNDVVGIVNAFGQQKEFSESDIKVLQSIGQMVAAEFERLSEEKEKEALREQLFHGQKLEAIGTLAGGIAHDFNNMLQGILGYAAYLKMKVPVDDPMYEPLTVIEDSAERAADLTKKLLGFARKGKYIPEPLNLNDVAENVIPIITRTFDRSIKIQTALKSDLWIVEGDRSQIEHVILNMCLNARDAMPEGGILSIETFNTEITKETKPYRHMKEGKYAVIKVIDTGTGMDEETLKRIFEPFFTTKEVGKGTGMGLPMAYGVVKNHNGFIEVDSAPGKGSAFTIYLPAIGEKAEREIEIAKPLHKGKGGILVIDDEEIIRNVARDILHELGYDVLLASGGKEGIKIYADKKDIIALVILDMIMPEMGGKETFKKLKEINPDVKILISSGYGQDSLPEQAMDNGEAGFIQKPYNINEIAKVINKVISSA
ncbi:MAG: response regulator [Nitrospirae bacterium]|nr:response regulator [Nitrospirota bacterium]MBI3377517.1 response regulator [Nitrospirota bacterium]